MNRRNLDTQGIGKIAFNYIQGIILEAGHLVQQIDGDLDIGIDGYIRIRKKVRFNKIIKGKLTPCENFVDTGNLVGIQVKGVSAIPLSGSHSYYIPYKDKSKFGVNFSSKENLDKKKLIWKNFVGPMILIFVDLETKACWWTDLNNETTYSVNDYSAAININKIFSSTSFREIKKLGRELFVVKELPEITTRNHHFFTLGLSNFKYTAREEYKNLSGLGQNNITTINPVLGQIKYSKSGWNHITRLNRRKMRIINSLLLLGVSHTICETVDKFTSVKRGQIRESNQYIKKVEFLTLRANVHFNFRQSSVVQVVLRRVRTFDKLNGAKVVPNQVFFHSIYEPYRKE
jgi:hypothetical protein